MARVARPSESKFGQLIRNRREELKMRKAEVAQKLGFSKGFIEVLETGHRGCNLDDLPRIAEVLQIDPKGLALVYIAERHSTLYRAVFGEGFPSLNSPLCGPHVQDVHWRLDQLPRRERGLVEALIYTLFDLVVNPGRRADT
jgi:transcriptional regulator with XRE-family HTH domain